MGRKKICVVTVTFNRADYLINLIEHLKSQTRKIDAILIYDNSSTDGTKTQIVKSGFANSDVENNLNKNIVDGTECYYYRSNVNSGGAGGFNGAFKIASNLGMDYLWVMDDDVAPEPECLENLLNNINDEVQICIPNRSTGTFKDVAIVEFDFKNPFKYFTKRKKYLKEYVDKEFVDVVDMPFEGPLISTQIVKHIGIPNAEYFIIYDDSDYARRALRHTKIRFIPSAKLNKMILPVRDKNKLMNWKDYYAYRNSIFFDRTYGENIFVKYISPIFLWGDLTLRAIYRRKYKNLSVINRAFKDGYLKKMGKTINPGEL